MQIWISLASAILPLLASASVGIEYEVQKTLSSINQAHSIDRGLQMLSAQFIQNGANLTTTAYTITDNNDPVMQITMGFVQADDLDSSTCQKDADDSCYFNTQLLTDSNAYAGDLIMEVAFKASGDIPPSLRSKVVIFYAMDLKVATERINKSSSGKVNHASISSFTCVNPSTALNNNVALGSISLQNTSSTTSPAYINILNRSNNALQLCAIT